MSDAIAGVGTILKRSDMASSETYTAIGEITNIGGPSMSRGTIDVTSFDSTGGYREFIAGLRDAGEVTLSMNFTASGYSDMKDDFESDDARNYQIVLPDTATTTLQFAGLVTQLPLDIPLDDKVSCDVTIKVSGRVELDPT